MIEDLVSGWAEMEAAQPDYDEAEAFYRGSKSEEFVSAKVERLIGQTGEKYRFPLVGSAVDVLESRCQVVRVSAPGDPQVTSWIEEVSEANRLEIYYPDLITKCFKHGDSYLMVWEDQVAPDETPSDEPVQHVGVQWTVHDARLVRVFYDPEDERVKTHAIKRWKITLEGEQNPRTRADVWYPDRLERWITKLNAQPGEATGWEPYTADNQPAEIPNPYGEVPFFHARTELLYGCPVHQRGYGSQLAFQKAGVLSVTTADAQGFPQRYGLQDPEAVMDAAMDGGDYLADDEANATDPATRGYGGTDSPLRNGVGTMQILEGLKEVGQFDEADPDNFLLPMKHWVTTMAQQTFTPLHDFQPQAQPPSGESRRVAEGPLVKRAAKMQKMLRGTIIDAWMFALKIAGKKAKKLHLSWSPPYVADGVDDWQMNELKLRCGVPMDQVLVEAGYEIATVREWLDKNPEQASLQQRILWVQGLAVAARDLSLAGVSASAGGWADTFNDLLTRATTATNKPA